MPKQIDKLRKIKYKASRLQGNSIASSMVNAGYKETTAYHRANQSALVKSCEQELMNEIKASDITVDWVVNRLTSELKATDCKASDRIRIAELLGKYLNMFRDNNIQQATIFIDSKVQEDARRVIAEQSNDVISVSV